MQEVRTTQRDVARGLLALRGLVRLSEFIEAGVSAATVTRMLADSAITKLGRGLYQLPDAPTDANHDLALVAKYVPNGVICLTSALAFHDLTDAIPARVWVAIGSRDYKPSVPWPALQVVRFREPLLRSGIETHEIAGVTVTITDPAKTVVDLFRYRQSAGRRYRVSPGPAPAIEGLREALRQRKATPAAIAQYAEAGGVWKVVRPYLEALTHG
jgi:predicted transcriptional regulator of viral defense system